MRLAAVVTPDDDWFMARCVEVAVVSQGPTVDEALANLTDSSPAVGVPGAACSAEPYVQRRSLRADPTAIPFPHTSGHTTGADPHVENGERGELVMQGLALVVLILVALAVATGRYGVDSREGFEWSARGRLSGR